MVNKIKISLIGFLSASAIFTGAISIVQTSSNIELWNVNNVEVPTPEYNYYDLISPMTSDPEDTGTNDNESLYMGRALKYFYANSVVIDERQLTYLERDFATLDVNDSSKKNSALAIQNLIASTINISLYGASADGEFFAESFSRWFNTPDELKNKSWEITNEFFTEVLPEIAAIGSNYEGNEGAIKQQVEKVVAEEDHVTYDLTLKTISSTPVDLGYTSDNATDLMASYWKGQKPGSTTTSSSNALNQLGTQLGFDATQKAIFTSGYQRMSGWFNDSYTPASTKSIQSFNDFKVQHWTTFESLNEHLLEVSKGYNGVSRLPYEDIYDAMEAEYSKGIPSSASGSDAITEYTSERTTELKQMTLDLYNTLFSLLGEEKWVDNVIIGFVVTPDYPLKDEKGSPTPGVMGYTMTSTSSNASHYPESVLYSYIVLTGISLLNKDYNSQYTSGWWSTPSGIATIPHEMGHALDGFIAKGNSNRVDSMSDSEKFRYGRLYEYGEYFGYDRSSDPTTPPVEPEQPEVDVDGTGLTTTQIIAIAVPVGLVALVGLVLAVALPKVLKKKAKQKKE